MSGLFRRLPMCVFLSDGYDSVTAAKLRNGFDICKFFEPRRAILRYEAVFDSLIHLPSTDLFERRPY